MASEEALVFMNIMILFRSDPFSYFFANVFTVEEVILKWAYILDVVVTEGWDHGAEMDDKMAATSHS